MLFLVNFSFSQAPDNGPTVGGSGGFDPVELYAWNNLTDRLNKSGAAKKADVRGSAYLFEEFRPAVIKFGGVNEKKLFARLNAYAGEIEIKEVNNGSEDIYGLIKSSKISCVLDGKEIEYLPYTDKEGGIFIGYLFKKYVGNKYVFYTRTKKVLMESKKAYSSLQRSFPTRFVGKEEFFIGKEGKPLRLVSLGKKEVLGLLSESEKVSAREFLKENRLRLKKENEIIRLLRYVDSLP